MMTFVSRLIRGIGDRRGVAAVEFALIAPILILLYMGLAEVTMALMADRRASHATAVIADLVAQDSLTSQADLNDLFSVAEEILSPFETTDMNIRVTGVVADADGAPQVEWTHSRGSVGGDPLAALPEDYMSPNERLILSEMSYGFSSPVQYALPGAVTLRSRYFLSPRGSEMVGCTDCPSE